MTQDSPVESPLPQTVAEAWLALLKARGVDHLFGNAGTDFPSIVEAFARAEVAGLALPEPILAPHETVATGMAHGYTMVTGRPQAVMVHVNVGTANSLAGLMNASRENIPMLFTAGRTPILEDGAPGARSGAIHWAQEMFDQAGIVREMVRWDYELRDPLQVTTVAERGLAIASSSPRGPVYVALPREVLAKPAADQPIAAKARMTAARPPAPNAEALEEAVAILAAAKHPLIIVTRMGLDQAAVPALAELAARHAIPVVDYRPRYMNIATDHPMYAGSEVKPWIAQADAILVVDSDVPWMPGAGGPSPDCKVIQIGPDPLFTRYPIRGFASDVTLAAESRATLLALDAALSARAGGADHAERRAKIAERRAVILSQTETRVAQGRASKPMGRTWISRAIGDAIRGTDAIVVNEYPIAPEIAGFTRPGSFYGSSSVSGLGWGLPAALGAQLVDRERLVIATLGDGAYMFANPIACHQTAQAHQLPVLTLVFNNSEWGAVRKATEQMYPGGHAMRRNTMPFVDLSPSPAFEDIVRACGGHGEKVTDPEALPAALARAIDIIRTERRQVLLNIACE